MEKARLSLQMFGKLFFAQCSELINPVLSNGLPPNLAADEPSTSFTMKGVDIGMASYSTYARAFNYHFSFQETYGICGVSSAGETCRTAQRLTEIRNTDSFNSV